MFSIRIFTIDFYMSRPVPKLDVCYSPFRKTSVKRVPILRVFGPTPAGQKACLHIHGVFPYLYVPYDGSQPVDKYLEEFALSIDKAINASMSESNAAFSNSWHQQTVFKISLVNGVPMYGYNPSPRPFLKIYIYNPNLVGRIADLLLTGAVMNKVFQPHEAHLPFTLQFFIDYNLYGMNWIKLNAVKFRITDDIQDMMSSEMTDLFVVDNCSLPSIALQPYLTPGEKIWNNQTISEQDCLSELERTSSCEVEVDAVAADIINRHDLINQVGINPGIQALWDDERQRRHDRNESSQLIKNPSQEREDPVVLETEQLFLKQIDKIIYGYDEALKNENYVKKDDSIQVNVTAALAFGNDAHTIQSDKDSYDICQADDSQFVKPSELNSSLNETIDLYEDEGSIDPDLVQLVAGLADDISSSQICETIPDDGEVSVLYGSGAINDSMSDEKLRLEKEELEESLEMSQAWNCKSTITENLNDSLSSQNMLFTSPEFTSGDTSHIFQLDGADDSSSTESLEDAASDLSSNDQPVTHKLADSLTKLKRIRRKSSVVNQMVTSIPVTPGKDDKSLDIPHRSQQSDHESKINRKRKLQPIVAVAQIISGKGNTKLPIESSNQKVTSTAQTDDEKSLAVAKIKSVPVLKFLDKNTKIDIFDGTFDSQMRDELVVDDMQSLEKSDHSLSASQVQSPSKKLKGQGIDDRTMKSCDFNFDEQMRRDFHVDKNTANIHGKKQPLATQRSNATLMRYFSKVTKVQQDGHSEVATPTNLNQTLGKQDDIASTINDTSNTTAVASNASNDENLLHSPAESLLWSSLGSGSITFPTCNNRTTSEDVMVNLSFPSPIHSSPNSTTPPLANSPNQHSNTSDSYFVGRAASQIGENMHRHNESQLELCESLEPLSSFGSVREGNDAHDTTLDSDIRPVLTSSLEDKKSQLSSALPVKIQTDISYRNLCYSLPLNESGVWRPNCDPPSKEDILSTCSQVGVLGAKFVEPYCSEAVDIPRRPKEIQGRFLRVKSDKISELPKFESGNNNTVYISGLSHWQLILSNSIHPYLRHFMKSSYNDLNYDRKVPKEILPVINSVRKADAVITPCKGPPTRKSICNDIEKRWKSSKKVVKLSASTESKEQFLPEDYSINFQDDTRKLNRVRGLDTHDCDLVIRSSFHNPKDGKASREVEHLTTLSLELHIGTRKDLSPDPEFDSVLGIFYHVHRDIPDGDALRKEITGMILVDTKLQKVPSSLHEHDELNIADLGLTSTQKSATIDNDPTVEEEHRSSSSFRSRKSQYQRQLLARCGVSDVIAEYVADEISLLLALVRLIRRWDPDILVGYEIQMLSWGYLLQRSKSLQIDLATLLSRVPSVNNKFQLELENDFQANYKTDVFIVGRVIVNIWRIMRYEVALRSYTFESVIDHVLHRRHALHTFRSLTDWFHDDRNRWRTIEYYIIRCRGNWRLLETFDMIDRSSEFARLYGIQFYSVLSRGSQFRIESMLLRLAKPMNYIPVSVSEKQRTWMKAPEVIPLVMEPESRFYSNPVLVLDFQSLYPSVMIAYNYCYTTCLGRISGIATDKEFKFGCTSHQVPLSLLKKLRNDISIAPCGAVYVKDHIRKGVIPRMLKEILDTRIMIKRAMKDCKDNKSLHRLLDIRQFGLKMIANVTYGYAGATFSGRMPLIELADSIVSKARETLERAIKIVNTTSKWNARVVYGDTDSMFVLLEGATKARAFEIGREIAETITSMNPKPVALKFEKVFLPSLLITKKRYVGYAYESADQKEPTFDAKGIETVRRDGCPAVSKIMEKAIRMLFSRRDMSLVKKYVLHKCRMLIEGKVAINDYVIAKEYRGKSTYKPGACVPALEITKQLLAHDRRSEPRIGERVPYVIVYGVPGVPLIRFVRRPLELLNDPNLRLNATYYITKQILPALDRLLSLIGIDVESWHAELPRSIRSDVINQSQFQVAKQGVISQYFSSLHCLVCEEMTVDGVCPSCIRDSQKAIMIAQQRISDFERKNRHLKEICCNCIGQRVINAECISLDCPILFETKRNQRDVDCIPRLREFISKISTIACSSIAEAQITG